MLQAQKHKEALRLYREALALYPEYTRAHYNCGVVLRLLGQMEEAAGSYEKALALDQEDAEAHNNLGVILRGLGRLEEAVASYRQALAIKPQNPETRNNLGVLFRELARMEEAAASYEQALLIKPEYAEAHYNLGVILEAQGKVAEAVICFHQALSCKPDFPQTHTYLAITAWIKGDWESCGKSLDHIANSNEILDADDLKFVVPYRNFLTGLLDYRAANASRYIKKKNLPSIFVVGDSHCLSAANTTVNFKGVDYLAEAKVVIGCKAWHLGNKDNNRFKYEFEKRIESIPAGAPAIFMFGEIDCRLEEGIIKNYKKNNTNLTDSIISLVDNYLSYIFRVVNSKGIIPVICNVPARLSGYDFVPDSDKKLQKEVPEIFNQALTDKVAQRSMQLLDVYSYAKSAAHCRIDNNHLRPDIYGLLLKELR
jgi:tetratricopeptide (TPR) repeat protein